MLQKLPVGIQTFDEIIGKDYLYIDKTEAIHLLIASGKYYFLSRPRRFGKSLTLSTLNAIFSGKRDLFKGLWIENQWDWDNIHPVIHLSFSSIGYKTLGLEAAIHAELQTISNGLGIVLEESSIDRQFRELIKKAAQQRKVVLLIDEYDKPLIDYLDDIPQAKTNQQILKMFYSVIKDSDPYLEFLLITGVSKFSKVSVFSDLNNLYDLTLDHKAATLVGYTQAELEHYFAPYFPAAEQRLKLSRTELLEKLRRWYNGYSWDTEHFVYNPYSILSFFSANAFRNFWFESGTPTFLIKLMRRDWLYQFDNLELSERAFSSYDIDYLETLPILFQTGYLTIKSIDEHNLYRLDYPNAEVKEALLEYMISNLRHEQTALGTPLVVHLHKAFQANDLEQVIEIIKSIFKKIPSQIFLKEAEAYYHSLIYLVFFYLGQYTEAEVNDSTGRIDCVVKTPTHIYIIEFKLNKSAKAALKQIKDKDYAGAYQTDPRLKVLLGINFSSKIKTVDDWLTETA
ncbi:PD-(D/E)XK nuclease superfamily protein [Thiothrix caldifontis]|uniref:PD-(D/E)XK nuclease superfamily protein n=1 Tax=Thiothrix caldifontis TaxID=525918 RepID=A0A1H4BHF6_9GAMM|nr:ATP-binding protein [Thiothrix caldifontis]SEA47438.1 PD-(D/E)XK nuclease superfamily protein [Thiothrix caldifontis]